MMAIVKRAYREIKLESHLPSALIAPSKQELKMRQRVTVS
jgi:hypothetical protein